MNNIKFNSLWKYDMEMEVLKNKRISRRVNILALWSHFKTSTFSFMANMFNIWAAHDYAEGSLHSL